MRGKLTKLLLPRKQLKSIWICLSETVVGYLVILTRHAELYRATRTRASHLSVF